jgi:CobQ-like glutamine amidotransferase family enzyme
MTSIYSFEPSYFNQNGDQGNLEILEYVTGQKFQATNDPLADFMLVGDASRAAMRKFSAQLLGLKPFVETRLQTGLPTLLIGSSYEFFAQNSELLPNLSMGARVSKFVRVNHAGSQVVGYRNSEVTDSELYVRGNFVGTLLFGPVLAKNPELLKLFVEALSLSFTVGDEYWKLTEQARQNLIFD